MEQSSSDSQNETSISVKSAHKSTNSPALKHLNNKWLAIFPALVVFLAYLPALQFSFVSDDTTFLVDLPFYQSTTWLEMLFKPFVLVGNYFRPLGVLIFISELRLYGLTPGLFHLTSIVIHAINVALVCLLAWATLDKTTRKTGLKAPWLPIVIALIYGLHPVLIEAVTWVSSLFDLLVTMFLVLALLVDQKSKGLARPILVAVFFLLACLSKEMALALVLALPFWHLALSEPTLLENQPGNKLFTFWKDLFGAIRKNFSVYIGVFMAGIAYLAIRYASLGTILRSQSESTLKVGNFLQHFLLVAKSAAAYLLLIIWPFGSLSPTHFSQLPVAIDDLEAWISVFLVILWIAGLILLVRRNQTAGWLAVSGMIALFPVINIIPLEMGRTGFAAERFLTFPMVLFSLALGILVSGIGDANYKKNDAPWIASMPPLRTTVYFVAGLWLVACLGTIFSTLPNWRNDISLWTWAAERSPRSAYPPANLALDYINLGRFEPARTYSEKAVGLNSTDAYAWENLGLSQFYLKNYNEAQNAFQKAVDLDPQYVEAMNNLAASLREQNKLSEAKQILVGKVLQIAPNFPQAHMNLCEVYLLENRPDLANQEIQTARQLLPASQANVTQSLLNETLQPARWLQFGGLLMMQGDYQGAARAYDQARQLGAPVADAANGFSLALIQLKDWDNAESILSQVIQSNSQDARLYYNLGIVEREKGNIPAARQNFQKAIELNPGWDLPKQNLKLLQ